MVLTGAVAPVAAPASESLATPVDEVPDGSEQQERHDPIHVMSDAELMAPDAVAGNGVRGGSGTEDDPYRIAEWLISSQDQPAIHIEDITSHVLIQDLRVEQPEPRDESIGILIEDASNVRVRSVNVSGAQSAGIEAVRSDLIVSDSRFDLEPGRGFAVTCHRSNLTLRGSTVVRGAITTGSVVLGAPHTCHHVKLVDNTFPTHDEPQGNNVFADGSVVLRDNTGFPTIAVHVFSDTSQVAVQGNGFSQLIIEMAREDGTTLGSKVAKVADNRYRGKQPVGTLLKVVNAAGWRVQIVDNTFAEFDDHGITVEKTPVTIRRNAFWGLADDPGAQVIDVTADTGLYDQAEERGVHYQILTENDLIRSPRDERGDAIYYELRTPDGEPARGEESSSYRLPAPRNYWGPEPPVDRGDDHPPQPRWERHPRVDYEPVAEDPNVLTSDEIARYLDGGDAGPPLAGLEAAGAIAGLLVGISVLYGRRKGS